MSEKSPKGSLPYGWSVHVSTKYPDKVYYFNHVTGDTTWECPKLAPPRSLIDEKDKNFGDLKLKDKRKDSESFDSSDFSDDFIRKSPTLTAVVVPVVQKSKKLDSPATICEKKIVRFKRKIDTFEESIDTAKCSKSKEKFSPEKKKKYVSPLNKCSSEEIVATEDSMEAESIKLPDEGIANNIIVEQSANDSSMRDVEMLDVSLEVLNDLTEKKETEFDTSASYYIVVDTNVLIGELALISELKDTPLDGCGPPHIFIPWVVIEELDKLKNQRATNYKVIGSSCEAIRFLNKVLGKHPRFHGQSPSEAEEWAQTYSKCNDDKILECCLGLSSKMPPEKVILLTNDKNLVNKALICEINVHNFESMIKKIKPDTNFDYEEMKSKRKKKDRAGIEKMNEVPKGHNVPHDTAAERMLKTKRDACKREIHELMSNAHHLLKEVLFKFLSLEMLEAYGEIWHNFPVNTTLLQGLLKGIQDYWLSVYSLFFTEKDKRNFELLLNKASRPEGFFGDQEECLVILSAIEDVFAQINKRQPTLNVPVERIQDYRVLCVNAFTHCFEVENSLRAAEDESVRLLLDDNWTVINQMCGIIMDHYEITHDFDYHNTNHRYLDIEIEHSMVTVYPAVETIRKLLKEILKALKISKPIKSYIRQLSTQLLEFIPSLQLPGCEPSTYPSYSESALEKWFTCLQNRPRIEAGVQQIEKFYVKLDEAVRLMLNSSFRKD